MLREEKADYPHYSITAENEGKLTSTEAKFILNQAEKLLGEVNIQNENVVSRSLTIIGWIVAAMLGLISFGINRWMNICTIYDPVLLTCIFGTIYLFVISFMLRKNLRGVEYYPIGEQPTVLMSDNFFLADNTDREKWFYIKVAKKCQNKIISNKNDNEISWSRYEKNLMFVSLLPLFLLLFFFSMFYLLCWI